jgi:DNA replication initiation complex subunit (GINS family)
MNGTGLELIYNEQTERLEYFRIADLESLNIKSSPASMFSPRKVRDETAAEAGKKAESQQPDEVSLAGDIEKVEASSPDTQPQTGQEQGVCYKCTFSKNVLVNTSEQLVFAGDKLCINDIFWSKASAGRTDDTGAGTADDTETAAVTTEPGRQTADSDAEPDVTAPEPAEPNLPPGQLENIVVTCDNGFVILPRDSVRAQQDAAANEAEYAISAAGPPGRFDDNTGKTRFFTQRIDYNATTRDGIADGPSELTFYVGSASGADANEMPVPVKVTARKGAKFSNTSNKVVFEGDCLVTMPQSGLTKPKDVTFTASEITVNVPEDKSKRPDMFAAGPAELVFYMEDANGTDVNQEPVPVTVNAQKHARFLAASNQIVFEGDSSCTMIREDPNVLVKYMLLSEQITVDLPADTNDSSFAPGIGIKHLTATGDVVRLATTKTAKAEGAFAGQLQDADTAKLLGGVELKCSRLDYDAVRQEFLATGPGVIKLNNSKAPEPNEPVGRFSMQRPCWAVMDGFDTLTYFIRENRIVANAASQEKLRMDYIPAVDGRYDEYLSAKASHVEVLLYELPSGQTELSTLTATGGIEYEDKDNDFFGSELFYDHETAVVKVKGDTTQPCYYNGVPVYGIEMDVKTGIVKTEIVGPGTLRINR